MQFRAAVKKLPFAPPAYALLRLLRGRNARFAADYKQSSGAGSDLEATKVVAAALPAVLESLGVRTILDIPCGDFLWMRHVDLSAVTYIGADVIESLIPLTHICMNRREECSEPWTSSPAICQR
jgi:hypothetical protein